MVSSLMCGFFFVLMELLLSHHFITHCRFILLLSSAQIHTHTHTIHNEFCQLHLSGLNIVTHIHTRQGLSHFASTITPTPQTHTRDANVHTRHLNLLSSMGKIRSLIEKSSTSIERKAFTDIFLFDFSFFSATFVCAFVLCKHIHNPFQMNREISRIERSHMTHTHAHTVSLGFRELSFEKCRHHIDLTRV